MKKLITIAVVAVLVLSFGVVAYAAKNNRTSQPETRQGEQRPAEASKMNGEASSDLPEMNDQPPQMNGETPSGLPEMNGQPPQMNGEKPSGHPDVIDFDAMVKNGIISRETCDKIKAYMEENRPSELPEMKGRLPQTDGQAPEIGGQPPQMNGESPSGLSEMNGEHPANGGLLNDLLSNGIITQAEYDALSEAIAE